MKPVYPLYPEARVPNEQKLVTVADLDAFGEKMLSTIRMMIQGNGSLTSKKWLKSRIKKAQRWWHMGRLEKAMTKSDLN